MMTSSIRRCLAGFFKAVHPDVLGSKVPDEARQINTRAIQELNAYIDRLEANDVENYPTVARDIGFFKKTTGRSGRELPILKHCTMKLQSIPPGSDPFQKEAISIRLIRDLESLVQTQDTLFQPKPALHETIEPIISRLGKARRELSDLWEQETRHERLKLALFDSDDLPSAKREAYRQYVHDKTLNKLTNQYSKIKSNKIRRAQMAKIEAKLQAEIERKCAPEQPRVYVDEVEEKARVLSSGYHPDLVFFGDKILP
jgi:hypothetical protein